MKPFVTTFLACLLLAGATPSTHAQTFDVPLSVMAAQDGTFEVPFSVTGTSGGYFLGGYTITSIVNTTSGSVADCFCTNSCQLLEGETFQFSEQASLVNPVIAGRIHIEITPCASQWVTFTGEVEILPFDPTPTEDTSWSRIKRLLAPR